MSLTSPLTLVFLGLLTVGTPAAAYLLWWRVRGPRLARAASRGAMVVVAQVCAVLLVAVAINDYGQLYSSWSQFVGSLSVHSDVRTLIARSTGAGDLRHFGAPEGLAPLADLRVPAVPAADFRTPFRPLPGVAWTGWSSPQQWHTRGAVATVDLPGRTTGLSETGEVYLPPAYFSGDRTLPVVEVFSGYPGSAQELTARLKYPQFLREEIAQRRAVPMVLVMMRPAVTYPRDTECTNIPHGDQVLTYFGRDVPTAVRSIFGLRPPTYGAIGDSTGGYCSVKLGFAFPRLFTAVATLSGYYEAPEDPTTGDLYDGSIVAQHMNDLLWRLRHLHAPRLNVFVATSPQEIGTDGYRTQQRFLTLVRSPLSVDEFVLRHGFGHTYTTWTLEIPTALAWLSVHFVHAIDVHRVSHRVMARARSASASPR